MSKRKNGPRAARNRGRAQDEDESAPPLRTLIFQPRVLVVLAAIVSTAVATPYLLRQIPNLHQRDEYLITAGDIEISPPPPTWVSADFVEQVMSRSGHPEAISVLDSDVNEIVARAFQSHPWVERVIRVEKTVPARVVVELEFRRAVAMVAVKQGLYPVDGRGLLLPPDDFEPSDAQLYPLIRGVRSTPHGPAGTPWGDVALVGAARLAEELGAYWKELRLEAIEVPPIEQADVDADELVYELVTPGGTRIVWGRAPGTSHPGELATAQKIGRLETYRTDFDGFDQPHGPYEIDIRHWQEISRRPLASGRDRNRH